jgi:hypothetical protein
MPLSMSFLPSCRKVHHLDSHVKQTQFCSNVCEQMSTGAWWIAITAALVASRAAAFSLYNQKLTMIARPTHKPAAALSAARALKL